MKKKLNEWIETLIPIGGIGCMVVFLATAWALVWGIPLALGTAVVVAVLWALGVLP